jgi:hypothetical protein
VGNSGDHVEFEWFFPTPPKPEFAITIPNDKCFNLNQNLCSQILERIAVGVAGDGKVIKLKKEPEFGFRVPKSGTIQDINLVASIKKRGIKFPARYSVEQKEDYWLAVLVPPTASNPSKKMPKQARKNGLESMVRKEGSM